jgi:hypothetical protein
MLETIKGGETMREINIRIEGTAPLLQNRFSMDDKKPKAKLKDGSVDYAAQAETALFKNKNGVFEPANHIEAALIKAAANFRIPGKNRKTYKDLIKAALFVEPEEIQHVHQTHVVDTRAVVVQRARVVRYRPRFDKWALEFTARITNDQLPTEAVKDILEYVGEFVGIGDHRPRFGRFKVVKFEPS